METQQPAGSNVIVPAGAKELRIRAVVTRANGRVEYLGTISYWHPNPLRRAWFHVWKAINRVFGRAV